MQWSGKVQALARWLWWAVLGGAVAYLALILVLLLLFRVIGERWWVLWPLLYMPPQFTLVPVAVLVPLGVLLCPLALLADVATVVMIVFVYMGYSGSANAPHDPSPKLVVMTCNIGQRDQVPLTPFVRKTDADIVVLQDASRRLSAYARQYPERHVRESGEFVLISRLPIRSAALVEGVSWKGRPVAARFDLDWQGGTLVLYSVHLPTPRRELGRVLGRGFLKELARTHGWFGTDPATSVAASLATRLELVRALHQRISREEGMVLIAGDLNVPHWGYVYPVLKAGLRDAYAERGRGCGFTFPGNSRNPVTLFGPWLRLDYILCNRGLRSLAAEVEPYSRAQHRAVVAEIARADRDLP